ncbi:MAG TPA: TolC family protein, partial [Chitinispirillaceae bacterium]|nr:TolC family protein [Chitinispirillaceae bacterium]
KLMYVSVITTFLVTNLFPARAESSGIVELTLKRAVELAMQNNGTIKSLEHQLTAAEYSKKSAATVFLPKVSTNVTSKHQSGNDMISKLMGSSLDNSYSVGLEIQQPIFTGFATLNALQSAKTSYELQKTSCEKTELTVRYAVTRIYWGLVNLRKSCNVANEAVKQLEELTANQKARMEQGMATEHDYLLTDASLEQARLNVVNVEKSLASTQRLFSVYLGLPVESSIILTDTLSAAADTVLFNADSLLQAALQTRPDLKENNLQLALNEIGIKQARSAYFPTLAAGFSFSESRPDKLYKDQWGESWYFYASLNFNIFDWGDRVFKVKKAQSQKLSMLALLEQKRAMVKKEVLDAGESLEQSIRTLNATRKLEDAQAKSYQASVSKYEEGVIPLYELLDVHNDYVTARYKVLEASAALELARINLEMGGFGTSSSIQ